MRILYTIIIACVVLFIISFSLQNASEVPLKYYDFFDTVLPAYMLMFIAFLAGVIFTGLLGFVERLNLTRNIRQLSKTVRDLRREMRASETGNVSDEKNDLDKLVEP
jgi:uncharacterized integral membrane protein